MYCTELYASALFSRYGNIRIMCLHCTFFFKVTSKAKALRRYGISENIAVVINKICCSCMISEDIVLNNRPSMLKRYKKKLEFLQQFLSGSGNIL
jgi:hypothetical protein